MFLRNRQKGQSTVEYIVLVTGVIVILIAFLVSPSSPFAKRMNASLDIVTIQANTMAGRLTSAQGGDGDFTINAVNRDIIGNRIDAGLCPAGQTYDPLTHFCS